MFLCNFGIALLGFMGIVIVGVICLPYSPVHLLVLSLCTGIFFLFVLRK